MSCATLEQLSAAYKEYKREAPEELKDLSPVRWYNIGDWQITLKRAMTADEQKAYKLLYRIAWLHDRLSEAQHSGELFARKSQFSMPEKSGSSLFFAFFLCQAHAGQLRGKICWQAYHQGYNGQPFTSAT